MEEKLCGAAIIGDTTTLNQLLLQDPLVLDKATLKCSDKTPLHIAAMLGHVDFVRAILVVSSDMCLARDREGRNPSHLAAIKGKMEVLNVLILSRPSAAREKTNDGGTILHLCVKYNQLEALKILLQIIKDPDFLNAKNDEGMTMLHLAVVDLQLETIRFLVDNHNIDVNAKNANGKTALDVLTGNMNLEIARILEDSGGLRAEDLGQSSSGHGHTVRIKATEWLDKKRDAIMIVATLIATFAFQAGLNPAGGVWQDDLLAEVNMAAPPLRPHRAGEAIMAHYHPKYYRYFVRSNTIAFVSSLSTILLLISGLPFKRRFFMWCLMVIMWLTITSVALTYGISIMMITPKLYQKTLSHVTETAVTVWCFVMSLLLLGNTIRLIKRWIKGGGIKRMRSRRGKAVVQDDGKDKEVGTGLQIHKNVISLWID